MTNKIGLKAGDLKEHIEDEDLKQYWGYLVKFSQVNGKFDEDLFQKQVEQFYEIRNKFDEDRGSFSTFIFKCAQTLRSDHVKNKKERGDNEISNPQEVLKYLASSDDSVEKEVIFEEILNTVDDILSDEEIKILYFIFSEDMSYREIGDIMDYSHEWVRLQYKKAIDKLRKEVE